MDVISTYLHNSDSKVYVKCFYSQSKSKGTKGSIHSSIGTWNPEGGQLAFCFDLIFASKKERTVNKKVS